jgi:hypothetical protein
LSEDTSGAVPSLSNLSHAVLAEDDFSTFVDLRQKIASIAAFDNWQKSQKRGIDVKLQRLVKAIEGFLATPELFKTNVPREEFEVARGIIQALLSDVETALY